MSYSKFKRCFLKFAFATKLFKVQTLKMLQLPEISNSSISFFAFIQTVWELHAFKFKKQDSLLKNIRNVSCIRCYRYIIQKTNAHKICKSSVCHFTSSIQIALDIHRFILTSDFCKCYFIRFWVLTTWKHFFLHHCGCYEFIIQNENMLLIAGNVDFIPDVWIVIKKLM